MASASRWQEKLSGWPLLNCQSEHSSLSDEQENLLSPEVENPTCPPIACAQGAGRRGL